MVCSNYMIYLVLSKSKELHEELVAWHGPCIAQIVGRLAES